MMKKKSKILFSFCALVIAMLSMSIVAFADEPSQKPGKVTGVKQTDANSSSIDLDWDALLVDCYYQVDLSTDGVTWVTKTDQAYSATTWISGLNESTQYKVRVTAFTTYYDDNYNKIKVYGDSSDVITVTTKPNNPTNLKQTAATKDSITLEWDAVPGATGYYVYDGYLGSYSTVPNLVATVNTNKATISNLKVDNEYEFYVYAYIQAGNYIAVSSTDASIYNSKIRFIPNKMAADSIKVTNSWSNIKEMRLEWDEMPRVDGYELQICQHNKKKVIFKTTTTYSTSVYAKNIAANKFYKARVRAYVEINGQKKYGDWSAYEYVAHQPDVITAKQVGSKKEVKLRWDTVNGATNYTVYMSTKQKSGYKKITTTKKTNLNVKKLGKAKLKKNRKYYVYVVANKKVGKKTYKSYANYCWEFKLKK